jgi:hypothetical protein
MRRTALLLAPGLLLAVLANCDGVIGPAGEGPSPGGGAGAGSSSSPDGGFGPAPPLFSCAPSAVPEELPLPRLTRVQLQNTLQFALQRAVPSDAAAIWAQVEPTFAQYVPETITPAPGDLKGGFTRTNQTIEQNQIDTMYAVGVAIGQALTSTTARMTTMMGACATDTSTSNDAACLSSFIQSWGSRLLRYPLSSDDASFYAAIAGSTPVDPGAVQDVITALINAPETLYRVEHGTDDTAAVSPLSAFELAARLSYQFWQAPPDDTLWNLAVSGQLTDPTVYAQQVERLLQDPNAYQGLDEFVIQWLRLNELPPVDLLNTDPQFSAFAGAPLPDDSTTGNMVEDVVSAVHQAVHTGGTVSAFLRDNHSYATDSYTAGVYGVAPWDGKSPAPVPSSPLRAGLITRPGMLATGTVTTRPIHKGYLVRNALLCEQVGSPPANVNTTPPKSSAVETTRQAVTALTSSGVCASCHPTLINPPGFITESFDALGRLQTVEDVYGSTGSLLASLPIDTSAVPLVTPTDSRTMSEPAQLVSAIDQSQLLHSCIALRYFRFTYERNEDATADGCILSDLEKVSRSGAPVSTVFAHLVENQNYLQKRFQ